MKRLIEKEKFTLSITGGYEKDFEKYPTSEEIIEFIYNHYLDGVGYYPVAVGGLGNRLGDGKRNIPEYEIEAKIYKRYVLI
ncbi:hypothetical protein [Paenibacillus dendritiformis]|uniref:hypothetical protein n=1 Tax=Paenibacillus dendritiformis TaxID=130049 RepID=UPI00387E1079